MNTDFLDSNAFRIAKGKPGVLVIVAPEEWTKFGVEPGEPRAPSGVLQVYPVDQDSKLVVEARSGLYEPLRIRLCGIDTPVGDPPCLTKPLGKIQIVQRPQADVGSIVKAVRAKPYGNRSIRG